MPFRQSRKLDSLESWTVQKVSTQSGNFPDSQETFQTVRKISRQSGKFLDSLESSAQSEKFPDIVEIFQMVCIYSRRSGKYDWSCFDGRICGTLENVFF